MGAKYRTRTYLTGDASPFTNPGSERWQKAFASVLPFNSLKHELSCQPNRLTRGGSSPVEHLEVRYQHSTALSAENERGDVCLCSMGRKRRRWDSHRHCITLRAMGLTAFVVSVGISQWPTWLVFSCDLIAVKGWEQWNIEVREYFLFWPKFSRVIDNESFIYRAWTNENMYSRLSWRDIKSYAVGR